MQLHVFAPDPRLAPLLMHFLVVEYDGGESRLPARVSPALMLAVRGSGDVIETDGSLTRHPRFTLNGAVMSPRHTVNDAGTIGIFVMFRPGALQQVLGISAADITSRSIPMSEVVDPLRVERFLRQLDEERPIAEYVALLQEFLLANLKPEPKRSIAADFMAAHQKLFFPVVELASHFGIGARQLERRVQQAFGLSLRDMRRIARFGLTLPRLLAPSVAWGDLTQIAQESGYYDQAHMYREFVELSGLSPIQLVQKIASDDPAYWLYRIRQPDFNKLFIPVD
jgi:AraC-like DNA-binding protein